MDEQQLKKKCGYTRGKSCSNCKYFVKICGMGYGPDYYCEDERNQVHGMERGWAQGISVEPEGLCNYWEAE